MTVRDEWKRSTLEELGEKCGGIVLAGRDKVVAKVVVRSGVVERNDALSGGGRWLFPRPLPLFAFTRTGTWRLIGGHARKGRAALECVVEPALWPASVCRGCCSVGEGESALL